MAIPIFILLLFSCEKNHDKKDSLYVYDNVEKCEKIKPGMSYDEVIKIMGHPYRTRKLIKQGKEKEKLLFSSPPDASELLSCTIDKETMIVEKVDCDMG